MKKDLQRVWRIASIAVASVWFLFSTTLAWGQSASGRILGRITDPTAAVIPGVKVTATNVATGVNYDTLTNEFGDYQILALQIGDYKVTAEIPGFKTIVTKPQTLEL